MRRTVVLLSSLAVLLSSLLVPTAVADPRRAPAECAAALDCTAADIDLMSMPERLEFVRAMQAGPAAQLGAPDRWRNIEGVILFFHDHQLGPSGLLAGSSGFGPAWRVDGGKIVSLTA